MVRGDSCVREVTGEVAMIHAPAPCKCGKERGTPVRPEREDFLPHRIGSDQLEVIVKVSFDFAGRTTCIPVTGVEGPTATPVPGMV